MPILSAEPACYPEDLFAQQEAALENNQRLWVLHSKPRQEKALARELYTRKNSFFLPLRTQRSRSRGRTITSQIPLFSSYVFLLADDEERLQALKTNRVVHTLAVEDQRRLWFDLYQLKSLLYSQVAVSVEDSPPVGSIVEICSGPLAGLKGKLVGSDRAQRFLVEVDLIQKCAVVTLAEGTEIKPSRWNY